MSVKSSEEVGVSGGVQLPAVFQSVLVAPVQVRAVANTEGAAPSVARARSRRQSCGKV